MPTVTLMFAAVLATGPTAPTHLPLLTVSQPTGGLFAMRGAGFAAVDRASAEGLAPQAAPPPSAAPVAGPPTPAPVAGPPTAAPPGGSPAAAPPPATATSLVAPTPTVALPTTAELSAALDDAKTRQQVEDEDARRRVAAADDPTTTVVVKIPVRDYDAYAYDGGAYDELYERDPPELRISGYGGLSVRGSTIMHNPSVWVGGRGGILLGNRFAIGGAFYEVSYRHGGPIVTPRGRELGIRAAYGGVQASFVLVDRDRFEVDLDTLIGGGAACISSKKGYDDSDWRCIEAVKMFVTEPGLAARFEVIEWFRIGLSGGYRFVSRGQWRPPNDFQVSGPYIGLDFDFGWFARDDE